MPGKEGEQHMMSSNDARGDVINRMYLVAMALFLITVLIGILNGADAVTFNNDQILTHVHSGTLGWITLALIASAMWMFGSVDRRLSLALLILIPIYIAAFYSGNLPARAIGGTALLVAVVWVFVWVWRAWSANRTTPGLAIALGLTTFTYGAVVGVLQSVLQMIESGDTYLGVATDHVIESFRNQLWANYKTGTGIERALLAQFHPLEEALTAMGVVVWPMIELEADDALA